MPLNRSFLLPQILMNDKAEQLPYQTTHFQGSRDTKPLAQPK